MSNQPQTRKDSPRNFAQAAGIDDRLVVDARIDRITTSTDGTWTFQLSDGGAITRSVSIDGATARVTIANDGTITITGA